jgi:trans-2,3-dihydro-3-hydroxyanthranilate isomerase
MMHDSGSGRALYRPGADGRYTVVSRLAYRLLNVFAQAGVPFTGNPLCVFEDARGLDADTMQALARQFNLSETTFLLPSACANAHVRIFTPRYEMAFAGHPTLGSAAVCRALGLGGDTLQLELAAGIIPVVAREQRWTLTANAPSWRELELPGAELAALLGLDPAELAERPLWVKSGREQLIVPLRTDAAVRRVAPDPQLFERIRSEDGQAMAYVFAPVGKDQFLARFFFPLGRSVLEDPATGSATANLGGWWLAMGRPLPAALCLSQGEEVRRPSSLYLDIGADRSIRVAGEVVEIGRGSVEL